MIYGFGSSGRRVVGSRSSRYCSRPLCERLECRTLLTVSTVYDSLGFEAGTTPTLGVGVSGGFSSSARSTTPSGRRFLGEFGNSTAILSLAGLPAHAEVTVSFDVYVIRSWDGSYSLNNLGPDRFRVSADGANLLDTTFSNKNTLRWPNVTPMKQAYSTSNPNGDFPAMTGAAEAHSLGYNFSSSTGNYQSMDSVYRITRTFAHSGSMLSLSFAGSGLQALSDESWGLDNVVVTVPPPPVVPQIVSLTATGSDSPGNTVVVAAAEPIPLNVFKTDYETSTGQTVFGAALTFSGFVEHAESAPPDRFLWRLDAADGGANVAAGPVNSVPRILDLPTDTLGLNYDLVAGEDSDNNGALSPSEVVRTIRVHVVTTELMINGTVDTADDNVLLSTPRYGSDIDANSPVATAAVRLVNSEWLQQDAVPVTIHSNSSRLVFSASDNAELPNAPAMLAALPKNGDSVGVLVRGVGVSAAVGGDHIRVTGSVLGRVGAVEIGKKEMTVYWFGETDLFVDTKLTYGIIDEPGFRSRLTVVGAPPEPDRKYSESVAVAIKAKTSISPADVRPAKQLYIGIVQNIVTSRRYAKYDNPAVVIRNAAGVVQVGKIVVWEGRLNDVRNDHIPGQGPLYTTPDEPRRPGWAAEFYRDSVKPIGVNNPEYAWVFDTPSQTALKEWVSDELVDANGTVLGRVAHKLEGVGIHDVFRVFAVVCEQLPQGGWRVIAPLRQAGWRLEVYGNNPALNAGAVADNAGDGVAVTNDPVLRGPTFNEWINDSSVYQAVYSNDKVQVVFQ